MRGHGIRSLFLSPPLSLLNTEGGKGLYSEDVSSGYIYLILAAALQIQGSWNTLVYEVCVAMYALFVCARAIPGWLNFLSLVEECITRLLLLLLLHF